MDYQPDRFDRLRAFLEDAYARPSAEMTPRVRLELDKARPHLVALLDRKGKDPKEEAELKKGRFTLGGSQMEANPDFIQEALFLSSQLSLSETHSARLLQYSMTQKSRYQRGDADTAAIFYYKERANLLRCLQLIFRDFSVDESDELENTGTRQVVERFRRGLVNADVSVGTGAAARGKWTDKLIKELDRAKEAISALKHQLTATTATTAHRPGGLGFGGGSAFGSNVASQNPPASAPPVAKFSDDVVLYMLEQTQRERRDLGQIVYAVSRSHLLAKPQITTLVGMLASTEPTDPIIVHLLVAVLAAWECEAEGVESEEEAAYLDGLQTDQGFLISMSEQLRNKKWTVKQVRAVAMLQWGMFLEAAYQQDPELEARLQIWYEEVENMILMGIQNDAFSFLAYDVLSFKQPSDPSSSDPPHRRILGQGRSEEATRTATKDELLGIETDFQDTVVGQIDQTIVTFVTSQQSLLRKLRHREEDAIGAFQMAAFRPTDDPAGLSPPRRDVEDLFAVIGALHRERPDSGLVYWGDAGEDTAMRSTDGAAAGPSPRPTSRFAYFLRWAAECRIPEMVPSVYEMLTSLATGPQSAEKAYEFFQTAATETDPSPSPCSWVHLFRALRHYVVHLGQTEGPAGGGVGGEIHPEEARHLRAYIHLLRQVVRDSLSARITLYNHQRYRPIQTIFSLVGYRISLELKADLLSTLAAFATPGDSTSAEIAQMCWIQLEQSQILSTVPQTGFGSPWGPLVRAGVLAELEEVEAPNRIYPQSTAFVALLAALVHPAKRSSPLRGGAELELQSIPDNLGGSHRPPGIDPYLRFVVEEMLQKAGSRDYQHPQDAYRVFEICLTFVERCLTGYDLGPVLASGAVGEHRAQNVINACQRTMAHPGFDIMLRILSNTEITRQLLDTIATGPLHLANVTSADDPISRCVLRALRIFNRVTELQGPFLEVVLPMIAETGSTAFLPHHSEMVRQVEPLDQHIFHANAVVISTAVLVGQQLDDEMALLAVKLLSFVAESRFFNSMDQYKVGKRSGRMNRLLGLIEGSEESDVIVAAFLGRIEAAAFAFSDLDDSDDFVLDAADDLEDRDMAKFAAATRSAILDLLLLNTQPTRPGPNIAHFFLGFDVRAPPERLVIESRDSRKARLSCLHAVLDLLDVGLGADDADDDAPAIPLLDRDPLFAEKCYRLVRQLCLSDYSSAAVSRFLRTSKNFFVLQAQSLPLPVPEVEAGGTGTLTYTDGRRLRTSCAAVVASLHAMAWLLETIALELNTLTSEGLRDQTLELVSILFDSGAQPQAMNVLDLKGRPEQVLPCVQEILFSLAADWTDDLDAPPIKLSFFSGVDWNQTLQLDSTGCEQYDTTAVLALLGAARRDAQNRGLLSSAAQQEEMKTELRATLQALVVENHRREIAFAKLHSLKAWRTLLELSLTRAFHLLPPEGRQIFTLDLLSTCLEQVVATQTDTPTGELFSEVIVSLMAKLRHEARQIGTLAAGDSAQAFPVDRLLPMLDSILQGILRSAASNIVRGNLYAALLNFLHYVQAVSSSTSISPSPEPDDLASGSDLVAANAQRSSLETGTMAKLSPLFERLLPEICRDATMGLEVWRTVAFTVLDGLLMTADRSRYGAKVLSMLERDGSLKRFVDLLKESEPAILNALEPDPPSLNALYVYEAQVSFLTRIASSRIGAEKLLQCQVIERLGACDYLRPSSRDVSTMTEFDSFLPSVSERRHQLLLPALQLVSALVISVGIHNGASASKALAFTIAQRESLLAVLHDSGRLSSSAGLQETHLITLIMSTALPVVSDDDMVSSTGFGALHSAQLALAARVCGGQTWTRSVTQRAVQDQMAVLPAGAVEGDTSSPPPSLERALSLQSSLLAYLRTTSTRTPQATFYPVLLPTLKHIESSTGVLGVGPSFGSTFNLLRESTDALAGTLLECAEVDRQAKDWTRLGTADVDEILRSEGVHAASGSDAKASARSILLRGLNKLRGRAITLLNIIETALLLLWRNADYYFRPGPGSTPGRAFGRPKSIDPSMREDCQLSMRPVVGRLQALDFSQAGLSDAESRERHAYLQSLVRHLADLFAGADAA